eukprot:5380425-Amphidinium_carterae.1
MPQLAFARLAHESLAMVVLLDSLDRLRSHCPLTENRLLQKGDAPAEAPHPHQLAGGKGGQKQVVGKS